MSSKLASTKWNFHQYSPGIVGGHCIPTVPYFLAYAAKREGFMPRLILTARQTNDFMIPFISELVTTNLASSGKTIAGSKIAILGLTYKENVPDYRDNPVTDLIRNLREKEILVFGYDPLLSDEEIAQFGVTPLQNIGRQMDGYILAAPHDTFIRMAGKEFAGIAGPDVLFIDIKGVFHKDDNFKKMFRYLTL